MKLSILKRKLLCEDIFFFQGNLVTVQQNLVRPELHWKHQLFLSHSITHPHSTSIFTEYQCSKSMQKRKNSHNLPSPTYMGKEGVISKIQQEWFKSHHRLYSVNAACYWAITTCITESSKYIRKRPLPEGKCWRQFIQSVQEHGECFASPFWRRSLHITCN